MYVYVLIVYVRWLTTFDQLFYVTELPYYIDITPTQSAKLNAAQCYFKATPVFTE